MSVKVMSRVWDSELGGSDKLMLLALADRADEDGICWPGIEYLAKKCSVLPRQAQKIIRRLEEAKAVHVETGGGKGKTNSYFILTGLSSAEIKETLMKRYKKSDDEAEIILQTIFSNPVTEDTVSAPNPVPQDTVSNPVLQDTVSGANPVAEDTVSAPNPVLQGRKPCPTGHPILLYPLNKHDSFIRHADLDFNGSVAKKLWDEVLGDLKHKMTRNQFAEHFQHTEVIGGYQGQLLVLAKNDRSHQVVTNLLGAVVNRALDPDNAHGIESIEFIKPSGVRNGE